MTALHQARCVAPYAAPARVVQWSPARHCVGCRSSGLWACPTDIGKSWAIMISIPDAGKWDVQMCRYPTRARWHLCQAQRPRGRSCPFAHVLPPGAWKRCHGRGRVGCASWGGSWNRISCSWDAWRGRRPSGSMKDRNQRGCGRTKKENWRLHRWYACWCESQVWGVGSWTGRSGFRGDRSL